ncbi:peptidoglycan D,D-transpeptidase FtsI family protein [Candidatus Nitrosacidococcus tergens]|uniref:Peptidoglycan D,D-transpeptidase FtsI n=1 Tax=Candidatus Nitrosacidococcus tergens TaxID=553981 RepID=A0A7G1QB12_9GAMM|nr:penicillin-binding transpeptidase domain-containing protein [Candidatus Nitrosacidococcus tergens]CAB1276944.1 transpeptidase involved in septal peptidoglycan synthesis (penicillin-binding protein 3) [Candidatus Nitrosacidococcus tergens]
MKRNKNKPYFTRLQAVGFIFSLIIISLVVRLIKLQVLDYDFLRGKGETRHLRVVTIPVHRGMITDRHGEPLAVSTPVDSIWINPKLLSQTPEQWAVLGNTLGVSRNYIADKVQKGATHEFAYLKRWAEPELANRIQALDILGVGFQSEYKRYYPTGPLAAHVVGFTNVDDIGQEGIELGFNSVLQGIPGKKRIIRDSRGRTIGDIENIRTPQPGEDLRLSIDLQLQYLAYQKLKDAIQIHEAQAGSIVILDVHTGEILAMTSQPSYNPNDYTQRQGQLYRNRSITDLFEPGSTIKPFIMGIALMLGKVTPYTFFDTTPGYLQIGRYTIHDVHNYGRIDIGTIIQKSSNVGISKVALDLDPQQFFQNFSQLEFGMSTASGFPGEVEGHLPNPNTFQKSEIARATLSFGYGLSVTALQLARAYAMIGAGGILRPASFFYQKQPTEGKFIWTKEIAHAVLTMLERVTINGGTGTQARVPGYRVAGKTGTVKKTHAGHYTKNKYIALFAGLVPVSNPRLAAVIMIDNPKKGGYYGGTIAAPIFSQIMIDAMRLLNIAPDNLQTAYGK